MPEFFEQKKFWDATERVFDIFTEWALELDGVSGWAPEIYMEGWRKAIDADRVKGISPRLNYLMFGQFLSEAQQMEIFIMCGQEALDAVLEAAEKEARENMPEGYSHLEWTQKRW